MTRKSQLLAAPLMLFVALAAFSQTPARIATAERTWASFWRQFTLAINKKNHAPLLRMMPSDFFDGGGGLTPKGWLKFIDETNRMDLGETRENPWLAEPISIGLGAP